MYVSSHDWNFIKDVNSTLNCLLLEQIEAIMNDFIQLKPETYEAETMVEGWDMYILLLNVLSLLIISEAVNISLTLLFGMSRNTRGFLI